MKTIEHIAIIMDGNGRWAQQRGLYRSRGHQEGYETAKKIVKAVSALKIPYITLYAFSTENWKRTTEEVGFLMRLIKKHLRAEFQFYVENNIRMIHIGNLSALPKDIQKEISDVTEKTKHHAGTAVVFAINYGGKDEIIRALQKIPADKINSITESSFSEYLDYPLPDVDLLIRTGGEKRISNFLLWQTAYAELYFTDTLWPDFTEDDLHQALQSYKHRDRRFGGIT
ncbi:di-trans,poly-cis-decaprenylcistransferase [Treponema phagedenis]|uniref:Isoprenyl transferase n=1 Tax=Treponema phagedenis TaxID=162 RepID=A0A0B7GW85_TREPH|nr:polyprenyl diphosphate synthase [Treponema phagedenis]QEJ94562.1 di-trans,poly-cis-decaprenylcistransferase [Treponema phagedenis]QEJ98691.1 di-trans,poly-cis-decaprenylcistransferase [Treponema phagedenis]QEK01560.1 di-trans,poly-cis-decaprenylcistransferase [Treponema phagedenis]QEK04196.1 di-trans,poly-cis-decaprenylcistransferase [Treponema phagedenis]QEK06647.1 di-trans,poly-cis-decaprenylcistransferase [Treponema phagedenis]